MPRVPIQDKKFGVSIDSIMGGLTALWAEGNPDQFHSSIGIDPDIAISASLVKTSGALVPSHYADFSSTILSSYINWIVAAAQGGTTYVFAADGEFIEYSSALTSTSENLISTPTSGAGDGMAYYNNYIYLKSGTDLSRYGPINNVPVMAHGVWTSSTLGSQTQLGNATFPTNYGVTLPNAPMHVHFDRLYIGDFVSSTSSANAGKGLIHFVQTNRTTDQGDNNNGSTYNALDLPFDYAPMDIESWGNDLVIAATPMSGTGTNTTIIQGKAKLFFWDTLSEAPYRQITLVDPIVTALLNHNGNLFVFSGTMNDGVRVSVYEGGNSLRQLAFFEEGFSPPAGAVDGLGNRIVWGARTSYPENAACVYSLGYKDGRLPLSLHNIINTDASATATAGMVSALRYAQHASFISPRFIVAWRDASNFGFDKLDNASTNVAVWRSNIFNVGSPFRINKITIPLIDAVAANHTLIATVFVDDASASTALTTINNTNFASSERRIVLPVTNVRGTNNFFLQLRWSGTAVLRVGLPIIIEGELLENITR